MISSLPFCQKALIRWLFGEMLIRQLWSFLLLLLVIARLLIDGVFTSLKYEGDCLPNSMLDESFFEDKRAGICDLEEEVEEMCFYDSDPDEYC